MPGFLAQLFSCNTLTSVTVSTCQTLKILIVIHLFETRGICLHFYRPFGLVLILDARRKKLYVLCLIHTAQNLDQG